jgi:hypothetical protein
MKKKHQKTLSTDEFLVCRVSPNNNYELKQAHIKTEHRSQILCLIIISVVMFIRQTLVISKRMLVTISDEDTFIGCFWQIGDPCDYDSHS